MDEDIIDLLKIKIEKAKRELPLETVNAIDAVDWRAAILSLRAKHGYSFEQLGDLELETELVLCGLLSPESYPKELEQRMQISKMAAGELVNEMNELVFKKIREELIKNTERKKVFTSKAAVTKPEEEILHSAGIEIVEKKETLPVPDLPAVPSVQLMQAGKLEITAETHPLVAQKLSSPMQTPTVKTDHTLENITKPAGASSYPPRADPYRLAPGE